jgi:hypothetical protein
LAGKKRKLPKAALAQMKIAAAHASKKTGKTALEIFKEYYLRLMDKYSDYFFSGPWPKKFDINHATNFTREDLDFIDENEDEYVDRVETVMLKKNISLAGFNAIGATLWTRQAYFKQFIRPELKPLFDILKKLAETGTSSEEILTKLKEECEVLSVIHWSLVDLLEVEYLEGQLDLRTAEVLELIHTKEGYPDCEENRCKYQREKLKKKPS